MEIQRLIYHGNREQGKITVGRLDVLSPWREFKFYKGLNFQVGKVVPLDVAKILAKDYPDHFRIETKELDDEGVHEYQLSDAVEECLAALGDNVALKVVSIVVEKFFEGYEVEKKEQPSEEAKKPKRRRRGK